MDLQLAVALSCTERECRVQCLGSAVCLDARCSAPMVENGIAVSPGQLVAVDTSARPPEVVFRWSCYQVRQVAGAATLSQDGRPVTVDALQGEAFPMIRALYQRWETLQALDPKEIVAQGYDRIAESYLAWAREARVEERARYTALLLDRLPPGAQVLDLGCGAGLPTTRALAGRFQVTGVDISSRQVALARRNVPQARFLQADMTQVDFPPASWDAVAAFYSLIHVPRDEQSGLLRRIASWLRPGGLLVAAMGTAGVKVDYDDDYLGAPMFWSSYGYAANRRLVEEAGLEIVSAQEETAEEHGRPVTFLWVVARRPSSAGEGSGDRDPAGGRRGR